MIKFRGKGVTIGEHWFAPSDAASAGVDVVYFFQQPGAADGAGREFHTLLIDLGRSVDQLEAAVSKNTLYKIKRADDRDGAVFTAWPSPDSQLLAEFRAFFGEFAAKRGLGAIGEKRLAAYAEAGALLLTRVSDAATGKVLGWHAYVRAAGRARLLYSATLRLADGADSQEKNRLGRLNRWHHWKDILYCKEAGLKTYDLGGWNPNPPDRGVEGINKFKEEFSDLKERSFDSMRAVTWKGRLYLLLKRLAG